MSMKIILNNSGAALAYVMVVMTVVFLLVAGIITVSINENYQSLYQTDHMKAHYISRAGAEVMAMEIIRLSRVDKDMLPQFSTMRYARPSSFTQDTDGNAFELMEGADDLLVSVYEDSSSGDEKYKVVSKGTYNGIEVTTELTMSYNVVTTLEHVLYAEILSGIAPQLIIGGAGSLNEITFHNSSYAGNVDDVSNGVEYDIPLKRIDWTESRFDDGTTLTPLADIFDVTTTPTSIINDGDSDLNTDDGDITITDSGTLKDDSDGIVIIDELIINTDNAEYYKQEYEPVNSYEQFELLNDEDNDNDVDGSEKFMIVYLESDTWVKDEVHIEGSNNVLIIVEDCLYMDGGLSIDGDCRVEIHFMDGNPDTGNTVDSLSASTNKNPSYDFVVENNMVYGREDHADQLKIYLYGSNQITANFATNGTVHGYIISQEAKIDMKNGDTDIYGAIYAKEIDIDANITIVSPDSSVVENSDFKVMSIDYWE